MRFEAPVFAKAWLAHAGDGPMTPDPATMAQVDREIEWTQAGLISGALQVARAHRGGEPVPEVWLNLITKYADAHNALQGRRAQLMAEETR